MALTLGLLFALICCAEAARGQDMTTFVSATGPGAQPQILKNTAQKKVRKGGKVAIT